MQSQSRNDAQTTHGVDSSPIATPKDQSWFYFITRFSGVLGDALAGDEVPKALFEGSIREAIINSLGHPIRDYRTSIAMVLASACSKLEVQQFLTEMVEHDNPRVKLTALAAIKGRVI